MCVQVTRAGSAGRGRKKRDWILPPARLMENVDYTKQEYVAKIRSDLDKHEKLHYSLSGVGADRDPANLFIVDPDTGFLRLTGMLDREKIHQYNLTGVAKFRNGTIAESGIELKVRVEDENDNPPTFELHKGIVRECSKVGTYVLNVTAKDADDVSTINAKVAYSILKQEPEGSKPVFTINRDTGEVYVKEPILDREMVDFYSLIVKGVDMDGAPGGNTGTGTVHIRVRDINDNVPTLEKEEYSGNVDEGVADVVVMRIKALDKDLEKTDNWLAVFNIVSGNDDGLFAIETDPVTNEGILKLVKPVDFEKVKSLDLGMEIANVAPFINGTLYPVSIAVNNLPDGPGFEPSVKEVPVSENPEDVKVPVVIASYPALDGDTGKVAENVKYAKGHDPANLFSINEDTAEITLNKVPDRESPFVVNGTYIAKILCMTQDAPSKTATGTIAIKVLDSNDHCPHLTSTYKAICSDTKIVNITAFDEDADPNGAPFLFTLIPEDTTGLWEAENLNDTTARFQALEHLWPGTYHLTVQVSDAQGLSCPDPQKFELQVCTCAAGEGCSLRASQLGTSSTIGAPAISLLLAGLGLLLFVPLLLMFCQCGNAANMLESFADMPFNIKEHLIQYHTEGQGEDAVKFPFRSSRSLMGGMSAKDQRSEMEFLSQRRTFRNNLHASHYMTFTHENNEGQDELDGMALPQAFLMNYYSQGGVPQKDALLVYDYEGQGSPAGSVGCCSLLESDSDLQFLDDLGPKFTTLAQICNPPKITVQPKAEPIRASKKVESVSAVTGHAVDIRQERPPPPPPPQTSITEVTNTLRSSSYQSSMHQNQQQSMSVSVGVPTQTILLQQQPLYYVMEPQMTNTVLMAAGSSVGGGQGMFLMNGAQAGEGMILPGAGGMMVVESFPGSGISHGTLSKGKVMRSQTISSHPKILQSPLMSSQAKPQIMWILEERTQKP
uniref:Cadherin domain-containing protein n=1 Tax=Denticeps clupeoides TaxID=299321 RepID=A0AAY4CUL9_9TELE